MLEIITSSTGKFIISQIVIIVSVYIGAIYAHAVVRRQKSFETIINSKSDSRLRSAWRLIHFIHDDPSKDIKKYAYKEHNKEKEADDIRYILNYYEYVFVGVKQKILDENILYDSQNSTVRTLYKQTKPFIEELRERVPQPTAYQVFEEYAKKWQTRYEQTPPHSGANL